VPFQADCGLENNELALFSTAMKHIEEKTSVRFRDTTPASTTIEWSWSITRSIVLVRGSGE
jgi:hypothetical protein